MMGQCHDCQWWVKSLGEQIAEQSWDWSPSSLGEDQGWCLLTLMGSHAGRDGVPENPKAETTLAFTQDDEGYLACLVTSADFGCVQWVRHVAPETVVEGSAA